MPEIIMICLEDRDIVNWVSP